MDSGRAQQPLRLSIYVSGALPMGRQGVHYSYWVCKAFMTLESLRATAVHSLIGSKTLPSEKNFIRLHMFPQLLAKES